MDVDLKQVAREVRKSILTQVLRPNWSLVARFATEILTYLYFKEMHDPTKLPPPLQGSLVLKGTRYSCALWRFG